MELGRNLNLDFSIILTLLKQGRNLFEPNINATNYMGVENPQNIIGLLDVYRDEIEQAGITIPLTDGFTGEAQINPDTGKVYDAFEMLEKVKESAITKATEMGIDVGGKSM